MAKEDERSRGRESIVRLGKPDQITGIATPERVVGRTILEWDHACGTSGERGGSPGFFGLRLAERGQLPEEWLILTLWFAFDWLELDGRWVSAHPTQYEIQRPLYSNFVIGNDKIAPELEIAPRLYWDEVTPRILSKTLWKFEVGKMHALLEIGGVTLRLNEDPTKRSRFGNGELRTLGPNEDLRNAWIISSTCSIDIG